MLNSFMINLVNRFVELALAPVYFSDILWIIIPLVTAMILIEVYFGRYKLQEIAWNTAYGNSIVLIFVSFDLIRFLYNNDLITPITFQSAITFGLIFIALFLIISTFFHVFPKEFIFNLETSAPINATAYVVAVFVYSKVPLDIYTFISGISLAVLIYLIIKLIWFLMPENFDV